MKNFLLLLAAVSMLLFFVPELQAAKIPVKEIQSAQPVTQKKSEHRLFHPRLAKVAKTAITYMLVGLLLVVAAGLVLWLAAEATVSILLLSAALAVAGGIVAYTGFINEPDALSIFVGILDMIIGGIVALISLFFLLLTAALS